jgi:hypothetical protein
VNIKRNGNMKSGVKDAYLSVELMVDQDPLLRAWTTVACSTPDCGEPVTYKQTQKIKRRSCPFSHGLPGERRYVSAGSMGGLLVWWSLASSCSKMDRPVSHQRVTSDRRLSRVNRSKRVASEASTVRITPRR